MTDHISCNQLLYEFILLTIILLSDSKLLRNLTTLGNSLICALTGQVKEKPTTICQRKYMYIKGLPTITLSHPVDIHVLKKIVLFFICCLINCSFKLRSYSTFWMTTFQILANSQYTKLWRVLTVKVGEISLPNPWLSSVTTLSNITDTICLTVAAAVVQIVASLMKYNLKHKTMALGVKQKKLVRLHEPFSCQRLSGQSWTWTELNRTELNTLFKHDGVFSRAGGVVYVEINK